MNQRSETSADLVLTIHQGEDVSGRILAQVVVTCCPLAGTHPHLAAAYSAIEAVDGKFENLPTAADVCPEIFAPVTVEASGIWAGGPVIYSRTFPNRCQASRGTNNVFDF